MLMAGHQGQRRAYRQSITDMLMVSIDISDVRIT
jgi:hypothetical protein